MAHKDNKIIIKYILNKYDKKTNIIDIGCGNGELLNTLSKKGYNNLTGIDFKIPNNNNFKFVKVDINKEEISSTQKFDLIISSHTIEHLKSPYNLIDLAYNYSGRRNS